MTYANFGTILRFFWKGKMRAPIKERIVVLRYARMDDAPRSVNKSPTGRKFELQLTRPILLEGLAVHFATRQGLQDDGRGP